MWFAAFVSALYLVSYAIVISPPVPAGMFVAFKHVLVFLLIGVAVSALSARLKNTENTYRNLFENLSTPHSR
ncbi:hypothetical protein [Methanogenium cariaci]|uniref:hypothetical protein n=1 Tax=Methanogenium cariaci TaxID=2197 RepID=UPI00078113D0|nr:hypothetical protein [Methanogenium cariaci]